MDQSNANSNLFRECYIRRANGSVSRASCSTKINMNIKTLGRFLTLFFIAFLPWSVVISVLGTEKIHLDIFRFTKEIVIILIAWLYLVDSFKKRIRFSVDLFDICTLAFAGLLVFVSLFQEVSLKGIIYWLRYDVGFLFVILLFRRVFSLWNISLYDVLKVFLISGWCMLVAGFLVRYVFDETILTLVWFSDTVSVWDAGGPPPIYHGIAGAAVVRFQWMLEGPNQMAFFLLLYLASYMTVFAQKKKYFFMNMLVVLALLFLLLQTYSRSGYLGAILGWAFVLAYTLFLVFKRWNIFRIYKITLAKIITFLLVISCVGLVFMLQFGNKIAPIFARHGSTSGHFERMYIGLLRFQEHPFGHGLAQAGPASRAIFSVNQDPIPDSAITDPTVAHVLSTLHKKNPDFVFNTETYYIPESWYIQLMIEWGIFGIILFAFIILIILFRLRKNKYLLGATLGILLMNLVLHSFESVHTVFMWSMIVASVMLIPQTSEKQKQL